MKTKYFIFAASALVALASCSNDEYIGDNSLTTPEGDGSIQFSYTMPNATRADIYGGEAATKLGNHFYVTGTKGTEAATYPTSTLVFDNYLVHYGVNTAGTTASNTANWEYVGVKPGTSPYENYAFLTSNTPARVADNQTIKYWDFSTDQYHFYAFSTGSHKAVTAAPTTGEIQVTNMAYGSALGGSGIAYTFTLPDVDALNQAYITDIVEVEKANYGKEVQLQFKSLGAKVRVGLYETVPGYSVRDVKFYSVEGLVTPTDLGVSTSTTAALISADANGIPQKGSIQVYFPHVGVNNSPEAVLPETPKADYNKASATIVGPGAGEGNYKKAPTFGTLTNLVAKEKSELNTAKDAVETGKVFLGRNITEATYAGDADVQYYSPIFPISSSSPLTLRVDYTLVPIDGASETIVVKGAKAVVPSNYTTWLPNYAYTYIFKISDNTNGWTGTTTESKGLFPITFDAVVAEAIDATGKQTTVTTVSTPTITTYQQKHDPTAQNEYSKAVGKDIYVQVMDNDIIPAQLVGVSPSGKPLLNTNAKEGTSASRLFKVTSAGIAISEATVMDALENRTTALNADDVTGRNGITLTKNANIDNTVTSIVNGADDNPISVTAGQAAKITISSLDNDATYAYLYDYTGASTTKNETTVYQPKTAAADYVIPTTEKYVTTTILDGIDTSVAANVTTADEAVNSSFVYFSKTNKTETSPGSGVYTYTYSFVSVDGKTTLPAGLVKCPVGSLTPGDGTTTVSGAAAAFVFTNYIHNDGKYAVKVIKIVA